MISLTDVTKVNKTNRWDDTNRYLLLELSTRSICCFDAFDALEATNDDEKIKDFEESLDAELSDTA